MKIIFPTDDADLSNAPVAIIHPTGELSVEATASKDVPAGTRYRIVADDYIPSDRTYREAWRDDFTTYDGIGGE